MIKKQFSDRSLILSLNRHARFNGEAYLAALNGTPCINGITVSVNKTLYLPTIEKQFIKLGFYSVFSKYTTTSEKEVTAFQDCYMLAGSKALLVFNLNTKENPSWYNYPWIELYYVQTEGNSTLLETVEEVKKIFRSLVKIPINKKHINFLIKTEQGFELKQKEIPSIKIDYDLNYNNNVSYKDIQAALVAEGSGFILFNGEPGTGKTSLIKYLINSIDRKFVFVPAFMAKELANPGFISFVFDQLTDSILVLEDGEEALMDRKTIIGSPVSTILNITDGIYGDLLGVKIISTQNTLENLDPALLRKGRLLQRVDFEKITAIQATKLSKKLKYNIIYQEEQVLSDVYNPEENGIKKSKQLGFTST